MSFSLTSGPAVFQALMNDILLDMLNCFVFVYLDNKLIFSMDKDTRVCHIWTRLLGNQLFIKAKKCEFHVPTVSFLGFIVSEGQIRKDLERVSTMASWPSPSCWKEVQWFLGFANFYRKFFRNFNAIAVQLHALTSPKSQFPWNPQAERAFVG